MFRLIDLRCLIASALLLALAGCGSDSPTSPGPGPGPGGGSPADFSGNWDLEFTVIGKKLCNSELGRIIETDGSITNEGDTFTVEFTIEDESLGGTLTLISTNDVGEACTETFEVEGARTNAPGSMEFVGSWDLELPELVTDCFETPNLKTRCVPISIENSTITIDDVDGLIVGTVDGDTARLFRQGSGETLFVELTVSGSYMSGTARFDDALDCGASRTVTASRKEVGCPDLSRFAGFWIVDMEILESDCAGAPVGTTGSVCMTILIDGGEIFLVTGDEDGFFTGSADGDEVTFPRNTSDEEIELTLRREGSQLVGDVDIFVLDGSCAGFNLRYGASCSPSSVACE